MKKLFGLLVFIFVWAMNAAVADALPNSLERGAYYIQNVKSGKYLNVSGGSYYNSTNVNIWKKRI